MPKMLFYFLIKQAIKVMLNSVQKHWMKVGALRKKCRNKIAWLHTELINVLQENKISPLALSLPLDRNYLISTGHKFTN